MATCSCILAWKIPMDRGACRATVPRVTKSRAGLKRLSAHTRFLIMVHREERKAACGYGIYWMTAVSVGGDWILGKMKKKKKLALFDSEVLEVMALLKNDSSKSLFLRMVVVVSSLSRVQLLGYCGL